MKKTFALLLALAMLVPALPARASETTVTVMIYLCGSDLESEDGSATGDVNEMLYADANPNVKIVLQTGGTAYWQNSVMQDGICQRFAIENGELVELETLGEADMLEGDALADFLSFCQTEYPADRSVLILWDHGGGPLYGFGYDEIFPDSTLTLGEIASALDQTNARIDLFAFDACLMGSLECALAVARHADYLLASEESVIWSGLSYATLLNALAENPDVPTAELGAAMADAYIDTADEDQVTMSLIDLDTLVNDAMPLVAAFANEAMGDIADGGYASFARSRANARAFGYAEYDLIDLIDLMERSGLTSGQKAADALRFAIAHNRASDDMTNANGLSVYFPYNNLSAMEELRDAWTGMDGLDETTGLLYAFADARSEGYVALDTEACPLDADTLPLTDKDEYWALSMSEAEWDEIAEIEMQVYADDGEGYVELGSDDWYEFDDDGDLIVDYDYEWLTLDGALLAYYAEYYEEDGDDWYNYGYAPALVNGKERELIVLWSGNWDGGRILGSREPYSDEGGYTAIRPLENGDVIEPLFDCYDYDGAYDDQYTLSEEVVFSPDMRVEYGDVGYDSLEIYYALTDVYGNIRYTESVFTD